MSSARLLLSMLAGLALAPNVHAARFTYHGQLMDGDAPAQGRYDLEVRAYPAPASTKTLGKEIVLPSVDVKDGRFAVELDLPEDADGMTWVQIAVRGSDSSESFTTLGERQPISKANSTCPGAWALDGNTGLPAGSFLGIADPAVSTTLELRARNSAVARFTPNNPAFFGDAPAVALGSSANSVSSNGATVAGGGSTHNGGLVCSNCLNRSLGNFATVGGGQANTADDNYATVAGGRHNTTSAVHGYQTVSGGEINRAGNFHATVPGGFYNFAGGVGSFAAGSHARVRTAGTPPAILPANLTASDYSNGAAHDGSFVWGDDSNLTTYTTGPNQFLVRASGGVGINTSTFGNAADLRLSELVIRNPDPGGNVDLTLITQTNRGYGLAVVPGSAGAAGEFFISETDARTATVGFTSRLRIDAAGTTFVQGGAVGNLSDARLKKNFAPIARPLETLLALQGRMFEYIDPAKSMNAPGPRMGFVAQDVQKVIADWVKPSGAEGYLAVTPIGFEALAVEAIRDLKAESDVRIERLEAENAALQTRLEAVLRSLERIEARQEH